jgi:hypothetical protein
MTSKEFLKGWTLLIAQPWGRRYEGDSEVARAQREFYFMTVKQVEGEHWFQTCCALAGKSEWPSIAAIKALVSPSGHPGAEQAWAIMAPKVKSDALTVFVTDPMREAYGAALALGVDMVGARMAFKETYLVAVNLAEANHEPPRWSMMPGTDPHQKELAIQEGIKKGIVTNIDWALRQLPVEVHPPILALVDDTKVKQIA